MTSNELNQKGLDYAFENNIRNYERVHAFILGLQDLPLWEHELIEDYKAGLSINLMGTE